MYQIEPVEPPETRRYKRNAGRLDRQEYRLHDVSRVPEGERLPDIARKYARDKGHSIGWCMPLNFLGQSLGWCWSSMDKAFALLVYNSDIP